MAPARTRARTRRRRPPRRRPRAPPRRRRRRPGAVAAAVAVPPPPPPPPDAHHPADAHHLADAGHVWRWPASGGIVVSAPAALSRRAIFGRVKSRRGRGALDANRLMTSATSSRSAAPLSRAAERRGVADSLQRRLQQPAPTGHRAWLPGLQHVPLDVPLGLPLDDASGFCTRPCTRFPAGDRNVAGAGGCGRTPGPRALECPSSQLVGTDRRSGSGWTGQVVPGQPTD